MLFSQRQGFRPRKEITYRDDLTSELRLPIYDILRHNLGSRLLMERVQKLFNPYGLDNIPRYDGPISVNKDEDEADTIAFKRFVLGCEWYQIYDLIEDAYAQLWFYEAELAPPDEEPRTTPMQNALNDYFVHAGIGWTLEDGKILSRQGEVLESAVRTTVQALSMGNRPTAATHIREALQSLSRRPKPNTAGAVAHGTSAVECVLNDITGQATTLGDYLKRFPNLVHPALRKALEGIYGFASDAGARHGKEGQEPSFEEAQFAVTACAAACAFLHACNPSAK